MSFDERLAWNLAAALLAVEWNEAALHAVLKEFLGDRRKRALRRLLESMLSEFQSSYRISPRRLSAFLLRSDYFEIARKGALKLKFALAPAVFAPAERFSSLDIPRLTTHGDLASWLRLSTNAIDWFMDARRLQSKAAAGRLSHYEYNFIARAEGPPRLLEAPKSRLKAIQRQILCEILDRVPVHDAAFGFVAGRSCVSAANRHVGERVVVTLDLKDFFLTTPMGRVNALYRRLGYPHSVSDCLTRLCGAVAPRSILDSLPCDRRFEAEACKRFEQLHLPQGAPTSPALANLVAFRLDMRLNGLARRLDLAYSRYADDLAFSGGEEFASSSRRFISVVEAIVREEGFSINPRKTRVMGRNMRQQVTGIVVNDHLNSPREYFDRLKATLNNCVKNGARVENRYAIRDFRAHLDGRVLWIERLNPRRGARLRELFHLIDWTA